MSLEIPAGWTRHGEEIHRTFTFAGFDKTMAFVNAVADIARTQDHHPTMVVGYKTCELRYTTFWKDALTEKDIRAADAVNRLSPPIPPLDDA